MTRDWLHLESMLKRLEFQIRNLSYVILRSSENTIQTKKDYQSGLFGWWRYNNWETDLQILTGAKAAMIENKCSAPRTVQKTSRIEEAMAVAERASEMAYQLMQQNPL